MSRNIDWSKPHLVKMNDALLELDNDSLDWNNTGEYRKKIEPWLTALFQSDHFSLFVGSGLTTALGFMGDFGAKGMERPDFPEEFKKKIQSEATKSAEKAARGTPNIEDDLRIAFELLRGYEIIQDDERRNLLKSTIETVLKEFGSGIIKTEEGFRIGVETKTQEMTTAQKALSYLQAFLLSFASRAASRDRLNIFTTNYERIIEYGCDQTGIHILDRFVGSLEPIFRASRLNLDYHYNPPGIRGEPRFVEGVVRLTKLHGSIDWKLRDDGQIVRHPLAFGDVGSFESLYGEETEAQQRLMIYPNASKAIETVMYPYSELFRDFSAAVCRPNSAVVTYGYGFGDSHINTILSDMLTIPSTHLVIISYGDSDHKIRRFYEQNNADQMSLLMGSHFGDLTTLVDHYLPKSAIDRIQVRMAQVLERRGNQNPGKEEEDDKTKKDN